MYLESDSLLDCKPEKGRMISVVSFLHHLFICILRDWFMLGISARVFPPEIDGHDDAQNRTHAQGAH